MSELLVNTIKKADGSGALTVPAESGTVVTTASPSLGRRNLIINGAMQVAQRGTSATGITATGYYSLDRFRIVLNTIGTYTIAQSSDAPVGFSHSYKVDCTTADASPTGGDAALVETTLEGQNLQQLKHGTSSAQPVTLSFYVKCNKTGTGQVNFRNFDAGRMVSGTYVINVADTWEYKTITFPADTGGTGFDSDANKSAIFEWWLDGGSNYNTGATPTAWEALSQADRNVSGTLAFADNTANEFYITGVQLEVGSVATPFEHRSYGEELALCQRYFHRQGDNSGSNTYEGFGACAAYSTTSARMVYSLPVQMRTSPSFTYNGSFQMTTGESINSSGAMYLADGGGNPVVCINIDSTSTLTKWYAYSVRSNNDVDAYFEFDAEL